MSAATPERLTFVQITERAWRVLRAPLAGLIFIALCTLILVYPKFTPSMPVALQVGDVAPADIRAPHDVEYVSQIETQAARNTALAAVQDVFTPADPGMRRKQIVRARQIMTFVDSVRHDTFASSDLKLEYLAQVSALNLSAEHAKTLLSITDTQFGAVGAEVVSLLDDAMSGVVKEEREQEVTRGLEGKVNPDLPEDLIGVTVAVAGDLVVPNSMLDVIATEEKRTEILNNTPAIERAFRQGEIVIRAGTVIKESDMEALAHLGLTPETMTWQDAVSASLVSTLALVVMGIYVIALRVTWVNKAGYFILIALLFLIFLLGAQLMVPGRTVTPYLFPAAALTLVLTALVGTDFAALVAVILAGMTGYMAGYSLEITVYFGLGGLIAAGSLRRARRLNDFFLAGVFVAVAGMGMILAFRLPDKATDPLGLAQLLAAATLNGLFSAGMALAILFVVGSLTGLTTSLKLIDLMRPDHPLQQRLQLEAPGTYQHTLSVANLAEAAAEAIEANSLLTRVGTLYHDIGKVTNPGFFIENRIEGGQNPHDRLNNPLASARIIRQHVTDGLSLARQHRLPVQVRDFISEHHGTMAISYFLNEAREQAVADGARVDERSFYYAGPIPQSRETAILMLADGCESAVRANRPQATDEIEAIIDRIIQQRLDMHQLDDSQLTLADIKAIKAVFVRTLKGMYHPRVKYPEDTKTPILPSGDKPRTLPSGVVDIFVPPVEVASTAGESPSAPHPDPQSGAPTGSGRSDDPLD